MLKETFLTTIGLLKFFFISIPVFLCVYSALLIYLEIKNLLQWKTK
jgi:hypothetical protein